MHLDLFVRIPQARIAIEVKYVVTAFSGVVNDERFDVPGVAASAADIAGWLGQRTVRRQETDNPEGAKEALVVALAPRFNRQVPKPRRAG